jgi:hypothetical protein
MAGMVGAEKGVTFGTGDASAGGYILELKKAKIEADQA